MRLPETRDLFAREFTFPVACETVVDRIGDEELDAPNGGSETIGTVLGRCQEEEFRSADELYDALLTFVGDAYIGRKFYDDRGAQPGEETEGVSF
ncbi:hypothetical protein [Halobaculum sp. MBLA0143]|uniref:DUF5789 family protein n=1 Tax=Halobaculum sp. MBLA0143 TaxID=3079933 RepID=UPI003523EDC9